MLWHAICFIPDRGNDKGAARHMQGRAIACGFALIAAGLAWTPAGQTSSPLLAMHELPAEIVNDCRPGQWSEACPDGRDFISRWIGRSAQGDLFLVRARHCPLHTSCRAYLVERSAGQPAVLLALDGPFGVHRGAGAYPAFEVRIALSDVQSAVSRFEWTGRAYARTASRLIYRVDGDDCGTAEQCREAARAALRRGDIERALKIWQQVDGIAWI